MLEGYENALRAAEDARDVDRMLGNCFNIGVLYGLNGEWGKKIEYCTRALRTADAFRQLRGM